MTPSSDILLRVLPGRIRGLPCMSDEAVPFEVPLVDQALTSDAADKVHDCLHEPSRLILTLPTIWSLTGTVDLEHVSTTHRRQQLLFKLEALLPFAVEDVVADFIVGSDTAWGVAVEHGALAIFLKRLEHHGHHVPWIVPETLLIFAGAASHAVQLFVQDSTLELLVYDEQGPRVWRRLPLDPVAGRDQLDHLPMDASAIELINAPERFSQAWLATQPENQTTALEIRDIESCLLDHAQAIFSEKLQPPIQLARGQLAPSHRWIFLQQPLKLALASLILCLVCLMASMLIRAHQYDTLADIYQQQLIDLYHQTFDTDQPPPSGIRLRLASQLRMAQALRSTSPLGEGTFRNGEPSHSSNPRSEGGNDRLADLMNFNALAILHVCLKQLPPDQRLLLLEIRVDANRITLTGRSRSHGEAGRLVQTLNRNSQLIFDDPRTRNLRDEQGVSFTTSGRCLPPNHLKPSAHPDDLAKVAVADKPILEEAWP